MAGARVSWTAVNTAFPEGTSPADHYIAHLGTLVSPNIPLGTLQYIFATVAPGDYASSVDTVAADGTVLATHSGNTLHVPTPVMVAVGMNVQAEVVP